MFEKPTYKEATSISVQATPAGNIKVAKPSELEQPASESSDSAVTVQPQSETTSVIGSEVVFKGELMAGEDIFIGGTIEGTIAHQTKNVIVGKKGRVRALIHATSVRVEGQVNGDIHGDDFVELIDGAEVDGDIYCSSIRIEKGAKLNGTVNMP